MMKLLHCVLIILNLLFVFGHVDLKQSLLKNLGNENLENIKDIIEKRLIAETSNIYKNGLKNALKKTVKVEEADKNIETKNKKKDVGNMILDDDVILLYDVESGRLLGRSNSGIENFLNNLSGTFGGRIIVTNNVNKRQYGAQRDRPSGCNRCRFRN